MDIACESSVHFGFYYYQNIFYITNYENKVI